MFNLLLKFSLNTCNKLNNSIQIKLNNYLINFIERSFNNLNKNFKKMVVELNKDENLLNLKKQELIEENKKLLNSINNCIKQLDQLNKTDVKSESNKKYPLETPKILNINLSKTLNENVKEYLQATDTQSQNKKENNNSKKNETEDQKIDVSRLDLRVGQIVDVSKHPDADKLYIEKINLGEEKPRTVVSGLVDHIKAEDLKDKLVVCLCNLKPAKLRGILSEAMVMCASKKEINKVELIVPPKTAVPGDRIIFEHYPGEPDAQLNPKKKIWESISVDLKTNKDGIATYKEDFFYIKEKGVVIVPTLTEASIK